MAKLAHHHPMRMSRAMDKAHDWFGKIVITAALIGGVVVLISVLTNHGTVTW
jgi:hypothetical protein